MTSVEEDKQAGNAVFGFDESPALSSLQTYCAPARYRATYMISVISLNNLRHNIFR